jgi:hypothetical protein
VPTVEETISDILAAPTWDQRVARIRLIPQQHGTGQHPAIYAAVAREAYVPNLAPDFAYIHEAPFYEHEYFEDVYRAAAGDTDNFRHVGVEDLATVIEADPRTLLRDTDGRVFTLANLPEMLTVAPFPSLLGLAQQ